MRIAFVIIALIALGEGYYIYDQYLREMTETGGAQIRSGMGHFTNPLLECDIGQGTIDAPKVNFEVALQKYVASLKEDSLKTDNISVYFRDLNNGPTAGVEFSEQFVPASLLKIPVMMSLYKQAERNSEFLHENFVYKQSNESSLQIFPPTNRLEDGKSYTLDELIEQMVTESDNEALDLLAPSLGGAEHIELYARLGVNGRLPLGDVLTISLKQYSSFFRILFNASYLSQEYSEKALELLSRSTFTRGLRAGVPTSVQVAHKFGEYADPGRSVYLHDCGIIYYPKHPYLLCIMTKGDDVDEQLGVIREISKFVYGKIDRAN